MFREMRRIKQQISTEECIRILKEEPRGVLAMIGDEGYPYAIPMDHFYEEETGKLIFHCAKVGHKMDAIKACDKVSYCVYDKGYRRDGEWALNINSVVIFGRIKPVEDEERIVDIVRKIGLKYAPSADIVEEEIERSVKNVACLELTIEHMTGKLVNES